MAKQGILKNIDKFNNIKLARGINLDDFGVFYRKQSKKSLSASMQKYGHLWFNLPNGQAIFKTYDGSYKKELKDLRIVNEMIVQSLAKQIGINYVKYEPAYINGDYGLVSYNFIRENESLVSLQNFLACDHSFDNNLSDISEACKFYKMIGYDINLEEVILDIYKIILLDTLTLQSDRHSTNLHFIKNNLEASFVVAPMFDNEFAFNIEQIYDLHNNDNNTTLTDILRTFSLTAKSITILSEQIIPTRFYSNLSNIINLAKHNTKFNVFLTTALKKANIKKAILQTQESGIIISPEYTEYICNVFNGVKRLYLKELEKPLEEDSVDIYDEYIK